MEFICYAGCSTCKKAQKWLDSKGIKYNNRDIKTNNPTKSELKEWHDLSNLELKRFFNTSGLKYKELNLSKKLVSLSVDEQFEILASDGMLVKRPLLVTDKKVLVGFKEEEWQELLK